MEYSLPPQVTYEYFVQNSDDLLGFLSVLTVYGVGRESARERLRCESALVRGDVTGVAVAVDHPPTFTIRRTPAFGMPVAEGMTVSLECEADVRPRMVGR